MTPSLLMIVIVSISAVAAAAQTPPEKEPGPLLPPAAEGDCDAVAGRDFEGFTIRSVALNHPFEFLPWVHRQLEDLRPRLKIVQNHEYSTADEIADFQLLKSQFLLPSTSSSAVPFRIDALVASLSDCRNHALNVEFDVVTSQFFSNPTPEARAQVFERPEDAANLTRPKTFELTPTVGYNATDSFFVGGRLRALIRRPVASLDHIDLDGAGSSTYQSVTGALNGSFALTSFGTIAWNLGYRYQSLPTDTDSMTESRFNGRILATTHQLNNAGMVVRFGAQVEGGNLQSGFQASDVGSESIASTTYSSARLYSGLTFGTKHTSFRSSYGFEVGANGGLGDDWRRHVGDASFDVWFPVGDHRPVQIESRFTAGAIQHASNVPIPVGKRFFGGNVEESFLESDDWDFRANPVLRSIPARQYNQTSNGVGAERFYSLNLTVSPAVWRQPLLPKEVAESPDLKMEVDKQWDLNAAILAANYITKDPRYPDVRAKLPAVRDALASLTIALNNSTASVSADIQPLFNACVASSRLGTRRVNSALNDDAAVSPDIKYGFLAALLRESKEQVLPKVIDACKNKLGPALNNPTVTAAADTLVQSFNDIETAYGKVNRDLAIQKGNEELVFAKRVFNTVMHDLNVWSISPVFTFDTARIWPETADGNGLRYGIGGGIRVTLVSHANFTVGYARNLHRIPQEDSGALFVAISITQLLR